MEVERAGCIIARMDQQGRRGHRLRQHEDAMQRVTQQAASEPPALPLEVDC